jgi:hypothetical protein
LKSNLTKPAPSLTFALVEAANGAVRLEWKGTTEHSAAALLAAPTDPEERSALEEAKDFLQDTLGNGPVDNKLVKKNAKEADIAEITLKRAKSILGVRSEKEGDGPWTWRLPDEATKGIADTLASGNDPLDPFDPLPIDKPHPPTDQGDQVIPFGSKEIKQEDHGDPLAGAGEVPLSMQDYEEDDGQGDQGDHGLGDARLDEEAPWYTHPLACGCRNCEKYG